MTSGNIKGNLTLIEHLLYTGHSEESLPVSALHRYLDGIAGQAGLAGVILTGDTK